MPMKIPLRLGSTKVKSSTARPRPGRSSHSPAPPARRSRSHNPEGRLAADSSAGRYPPSSSRRYSRARERSPEHRERSRSPTAAHSRHRRRRDSSASSAEGYVHRYEGEHRYGEAPGHIRSSSVVPGGDTRRRPLSGVYNQRPPRVRPGDLHRDEELLSEHRRERRYSVPDAYHPGGTTKYNHTSPHGSRPSRPPADSSPASGSSAQHARPPKPETGSAPTAESAGSNNFLFQMPAALTTAAGVQAILRNGDKVKEWMSWLDDLNEVPEEVQAMSAKAMTARDTIYQVKKTLEARPDLIEGESGERLRQQINSAVSGTDDILGKMTKLLDTISKRGSSGGNAIDGVENIWRSYQYKNEYEEEVKKADEELQKQMTVLSTLMVNLYSRSIMKPPPPGVTSSVPPPAPSHPEPARGPIAASPPIVPSPQMVSGKSAEPKPTFAEMSPTPPKIVEIGPDDDKQPMVEPVEDGVSPMTFPVKGDSGHSPEPAASVSPVSADSEPTSTSPQATSEAKQPDTDEDHHRDQAQYHPPTPIEAQDALLDAAWDGDIDKTARYLRLASADSRDVHGLTPLHLAAERDKLAVAILLLDRGSDIHARSDGGRMPLHLAARSASAPMVEMLLERGAADPNAQTSRGRTALHYAASKADDGDEDRREVLRLLRDWGADPLIEDRDGETARDVAQKREFWGAAATLKRAEKRWSEEHRQNWLQRHGFMKS